MDRRRYPSVPIIGVGAAVFKDKEILLIKRANPPLQDVWTLPGGRVLENETLVAAVKREILEECGISIHVGDLIDIFEYIEKDSMGKTTYHYLVFDFLAIYKSGETRAMSDAHETLWVKVEKLDEINVAEKAKEMILRGFEMLGLQP